MTANRKSMPNQRTYSNYKNPKRILKEINDYLDQGISNQAKYVKSINELRFLCSFFVIFTN